MKILIENLTFDTIIGILEGERTTPQTIIVDCTIDYAYNGSDFINYAEVADWIESTVKKKQFFLLEEALEFLGLELKNRFHLIETVSLIIRKPNILSNCIVGIQKEFIF